MDDPITSETTEGFGLMFFNARWLDPAIGRFTQADSIVPTSTQGVQAYDRYAYTNNNPLRYTDSSGHCINILIGAVIGGFAGAGVSYGRQVATNISQNGWSTNALTNNIDMGDIGAVALVGTISGGLIGSGVGVAAGVGMIASAAGTGMAASAIGYTVAATLGGDYQTNEMVGSAMIGAATGLATGGVSAVFAQPLPLNYGGILTDAGKYIAEMGINSAINGVASGGQTVWTNWVNGDSLSQGLGGSVVFGATVPPVVDILSSPGASSFIRSVAAEFFNNEAQRTIPRNGMINAR
jgi:RHS repeat-associated protein